MSKLSELVASYDEILSCSIVVSMNNETPDIMLLLLSSLSSTC